MAAHILKVPSLRNDDDFFPLSPTIFRARRFNVLPITMAQHIEPPFSVVNSLYKRNHHCLANSFYTSYHGSGVGNEEKDWKKAPRNMLQEQTWQLLSPSCADYSLGFTDVLLNGQIMSDMDVSTIEDMPSLQKMAFDPVPGHLPYGERPPTLEQGLARRHLELFRDARHKWSGCPESDLDRDRGPLPRCWHCEREKELTTTDEERAEMAFNSIHKHPRCPRNSSIHTIVGNLDVNQLTANGDPAHFTHVYSIKPLLQSTLMAQKDSIFREHRLDVHARQHLTHRISQLEIGFLSPDSALEMSLEADKRDKVVWRDHPYLEKTPIFREEQKKLQTHIAGPPLSNPSQTYLMNLWAEHQVANNQWDNITQGRPLPVTHPGKKREKKERTRPDTRHKIRLVCVLFTFEKNRGRTDGPTDGPADRQSGV